MMFEVSGTQRKISPVRYEIVFKSPSPGLSSPTTARETRLGQLVGAYRRHNIPAQAKSRKSPRKGKSSTAREHSDLEEPAHLNKDLDSLPEIDLAQV